MKLKVGDKIRVCGELVTVVESIEEKVKQVPKLDGLKITHESVDCIYWFKDEDGHLWFETKEAIEKL